jgi:hypothetical protein
MIDLEDMLIGDGTDDRGPALCEYVLVYTVTGGTATQPQPPAEAVKLSHKQLQKLTAAERAEYARERGRRAH